MRQGAQILAVLALLIAADTAATAGWTGAAPRTITMPAAPAAYCSGVDLTDLSRPRAFRYGISTAELRDTFLDRTGLGSQGYRPRRLTGYRAGADQLFATMWAKAAGPEWTVRFDLTGRAFGSLFSRMRGAHRPVDVSGYATPGGATRFAVVWERNTPKVDWRLHRDVSRAGMDDLVDGYAKSGFVPLRVEAYTSGGQLRYISIWVKTACNWRMHNRMNWREFQTRQAAYADTHRLVHQDAFTHDGTVSYAGIWWKQPGTPGIVQSDRDWYRYQRDLNTGSCIGASLENFYATDVPGAIRYGGIWTQTGSQGIGPNPSLETRVARDVNCAPGRGGAAIVNLATGQRTLLHADVGYGTASTIKSAILYSVLRKIDATEDTLDTMLTAGAQYGTNQGSTLATRRSYPLRTFMTTMIANSNNWATNRLIDYAGMSRINVDLRNLGFDGITLRRYMSGSGAPSAHGTTGPIGDYTAGFDNTAEPSQYAEFIGRMHENAGRLSRTSYTFYWATLGLNSGAHDAVLDAGVAQNRASMVALAEKAGSNTWSVSPAHRPQITGQHFQRSAAGRLVFANGQVVVYAVFVDEGTSASATPLQNMIDCVVMHAVRQYSGQSTGSVVPVCLGD